ncbi:MAG: efflux RND transporter permease subunit [Hyphomonadaceae bacterium]|nr:efflux RND transporter permease subunit [Hyphomonadaceae bacterium]
MLRSIVRFFVDSWQFSLVVFALLIALGASAVMSIPKSEDPIAEFPISVVVVTLPGADAEQMEKLVAIPLEQAFNRIEDVKEVESFASAGTASVNVEFRWGVDPRRKHDEFVRELNTVRPTLPAGIVDVRVLRANTANAAVAQLALVSDTAPVRQMEAFARDLRDQIERADGVQEAEIWGAPAAEVRVALDLDRLASQQLPPSAVVEALQREGADAPIGPMEAGGRRFNVQATGAFDSLEEIRATPLRAAEGRVLTVGDVAEVTWANDEVRHITRYNGKRAVFVTARGELGATVFDVRDAIHAGLPSFREQLPDTITLETGFDQSKTVAYRLGNLGRDFVIAILLVLVTLLPLGYRAALVVMVSIPLSLAIGVLAIQQLGFSMNQLSISGFVVALGLLVDDSIVVVENIARRLREGMSPREAAIAGVEEIDVAVIGCTAALIFAFLPVLALPEGAGNFIRSFPAAVLCTIAASLVVSLTIIPFLAGRLLPRTEAGHSNFFLDAVMGFIHRVYNPILHWALAAPRVTVIASLAVALASFGLVPRIGFSLFPENDSPYFMVDVELPQGASIAETDKAVRYADGLLAARDDIEWRFANTGYGNPQVYYNVFQERARPNIGQIYASFKKWDPKEGPKQVEQLRAAFDKYPGARISLRRFENGPPVDAPIAVRITGKDLATLTALAEQVEGIVRGTQGTRDVKNPLAARTVDLDLGIDQTKAALLGIPAGAIDQSLRIAVGGEQVASFRDPTGDAYPVRVRLPGDAAANVDDLGKLFVWNGQGGALPLSEVASPAFKSGPTQIERFQRERVVTVTASSAPGFLTSRVTQDVADQIAQLKPPPGYNISFGGQAQAASESFSGLGAAILIATFGVLAVLLLEFGTFAQMTVVAFVIPFGIMGGLIALYLTGYSLSFIAVIGFVALIGIEIKNSILLVDFTNKLRRDGVPLREAVERAGEIRFLPVLLTSATAIGGLIPLVLEFSPLYSPLALVIIGGLISSTLIARIVTPAMYLLLAPKDPEPEDAPVSAVARPAE